MQQSISRRLAVKYFCGGAAAALLPSQTKTSNIESTSRIKYIGDDFYTINGWVVTKQDLHLSAQR